MTAANNYFLKYHELVLRRMLSGQTQLYRHQQEALLAIYQKAARGEMNALQRAAALILAGVGTDKTLIQAPSDASAFANVLHFSLILLRKRSAALKLLLSAIKSMMLSMS